MHQWTLKDGTINAYKESGLRTITGQAIRGAGGYTVKDRNGNFVAYVHTRREALKALRELNRRIFILKYGECYTIKDFPRSHRQLICNAYHSGACDADVEAAAPYFVVDDPDRVREYLKGYGSWCQTELADDASNLRRLIWLVAADIHERGEAYISY